MYETSLNVIPKHYDEFVEDKILHDSLSDVVGSRINKPGHRRTRSQRPLRMVQNIGRFGNKATGLFGAVAQELTGKNGFEFNSAHAIVLRAIDHNASAEALARRIWNSLVAQGSCRLYLEDLTTAMGHDRQETAEECFHALGKEGNDNISLEEMIMAVAEIRHDRKSIASGMHDVDQALSALDALLLSIVSMVCVFVIICSITPSFTTTLATSATALLSLSFCFAATCQEVLGSCIFLFVKHPYDVGDRIDITGDQLTVERISLLYTIFKRVDSSKIVQTPNIVLNSLWIENITRSRAMRENVSFLCDIGTSFEDIDALKQELVTFVRDPTNARDFEANVELEVLSIVEMNKLELRVQIRYKSNWSNECLRASRRARFMIALVAALRKIRIAGPGGSNPTVGDDGKTI
ncbi:hypothetical protein DPSP01_014337 [Paraphaeosphaeria sporulosa]